MRSGGVLTYRKAQSDHRPRLPETELAEYHDVGAVGAIKASF
jgi:hypothetical protein